MNDPGDPFTDFPVDDGHPVGGQKTPFRTTVAQFLPSIAQIRLAALSKNVEQDFRLLQILVDFRDSFPAALTDDQLMKGISFRSGDIDQDAAAMKYGGWYGVIDQEVKKAKRLGLRLECR